MSDNRAEDDLPVDATEVEQIIPPEQPPMDDAAGPTDEDDYDGDQLDEKTFTRDDD
ncbi:hypothetical protein [Sphingomonas sp. PB4P5]|uniref:hypothetical protein n=1 Tax=Parasphingomonas puruogangriensis TaxID=3096155 RepID=UPI002FC8959D